MRPHFPAITSVLAAAILLASSPSAQPAAGAQVLATENLRLRTEPSPNARVVSSVPAGYPVYLGPCGGGWCLVSYLGIQGYVPERLLAPLVSPPVSLPSLEGGALREAAPDEGAPEARGDDERLACGAFEGQAEAQAAYRLDPTLQPDLDPDGDGIACEYLNLTVRGRFGGGTGWLGPLPAEIRSPAATPLTERPRRSTAASWAFGSAFTLFSLGCIAAYFLIDLAPTD